MEETLTCGICLDESAKPEHQTLCCKKFVHKACAAAMLYGGEASNIKNKPFVPIMCCYCRSPNWLTQVEKEKVQNIEIGNQIVGCDELKMFPVPYESPYMTIWQVKQHIAKFTSIPTTRLDILDVMGAVINDSATLLSARARPDHCLLEVYLKRH